MELLIRNMQWDLMAYLSSNSPCMTPPPALQTDWREVMKVHPRNRSPTPGQGPWVRARHIDGLPS